MTPAEQLAIAEQALLGKPKPPYDTAICVPLPEGGHFGVSFTADDDGIIIAVQLEP